MVHRQRCQQLAALGLALSLGLALTIGLLVLLASIALAQGPGEERKPLPPMPPEVIERLRPRRPPLRTGEIGALDTGLGVWVYETADRVWGTTTAVSGTVVTVTIKRGSTIITQQTTTVDKWGQYWPDPFSTDSQTDTIAPNDIIEVTTPTSMTTVTVAGISDIVVGNNGVVNGTAPPSNTVEVIIWQSAPNTCSRSLFTQTVTSTLGGTYTAVFTWVRRGASVTVQVIDAESNGTEIGQWAPIIEVYPYLSRLNGSVRPLQTVTTTLLDSSDNQIETFTFRASKDGSFGRLFSVEMLSGDKIRVTTADGTREVVVSLTASINLQNDTVFGNGPAGNVPVVVQPKDTDPPLGWFCKVVTTSTTAPYTYSADFSNESGLFDMGDYVDVSHANANEDVLWAYAEGLATYTYLPVVLKNQ